MSIGNFDGVHLGHRAILSLCRELAGRGGGGLKITAVTFEPHPLTVLRPSAVPPRLTPKALKERLLAEAGVDELVILPPDRAVLDLTAEDFWKLLRDRVRPAHLVEGRDFNFGKNRGGNTQRLVEWAAGSDVKLHVAPPVSAPLLDLLIAPVSSSLIRWLIGEGRVRDAAICLGRPFLAAGTVVAGQKRGRTLGCPTANLDCGDQMIPGDGVYAGACAAGGRRYAAAISVGVARMFGDVERRVEAHLIGFDGDLYGQALELEFLDWLRGMERFVSAEALREQLGRDIASAGEAADRFGVAGVARPIAKLELTAG